MYGSESPAESLAELSSLDFYLLGLEKISAEKISAEKIFEMKITKRSDIRKSFPLILITPTHVLGM